MSPEKYQTSFLQLLHIDWLRHCWQIRNRHIVKLYLFVSYFYVNSGESLLRWFFCCISTFDPAKHAIPKTVEVIHSDGSYGKKWRRRTWLTIWDKVKSHGIVIDWCTGREWFVNCMTVISAWWQSNMPFQGQRKWHIPMASYGEILSGRLNYYITRWRQKVSEFGDQTRWWQDAVEEASI